MTSAGNTKFEASKGKGLRLLALSCRVGDMITPGNKITLEPAKSPFEGKTRVTYEVVESENHSSSTTLLVPNELMPLLGSMVSQYNADPKFLTTYVSDEKKID